MKTVSSVTASWSSIGLRGWLSSLCFALAGCHFDAQPLFEPLGAAPAAAGMGMRDTQPRSDAGTGLAANSGDDDSGSPAVTTGVSEVCTPAEISGCDGNQLLTCDDAGGSMLRQDCGGAGCNDAAKRCNTCRPSSRSCNGDKLVSCDADGVSSSEQACDIGCVTTNVGEAACRNCAQGMASCRQDDLVQCAPDGQSEQTTHCARGCDDQTLTCKGILAPTNIPRDACSWSDFAEKERTISSSTTIDTERDCPRVITQGQGLPDLCVLAFETLRVSRGATLRVTGSRALVLLATRSLQLDGRISVSARAALQGAGSLMNGQGQGRDGIGRVPQGMPVGEWTSLPANAGGGGGGYLTPGAAGGGAPGDGDCSPGRACAEPGAGGARYGVEALVPLGGGSGGGQNSAASWSTRRGAAGGGGGALQLVACEELKLGRTAVLDANGGGGQGGQPGAAEMDSPTPGAGAGGGSGGAILIQARQLTAESGAWLVANGGGGGGGAARVAGPAPMMGMPNMPAKTGEAGGDGQDGLLNATPASGGQGAGASQPGGAGGAKDPPADGGRARQNMVAAGGGGGAAGRIRIETAVDPGPRAGILMSPPATYGTVAVE